MKGRQLKDREVKIKREIEELLFKLIIVSLDNMDKFEEKERKKMRPIKNTWYDWLINYFRNPIDKSVDSFKDKIVRQTHLNKSCMGKEKKLSQPETQNQIKNIRNPFILKKKKKENNENN